MTPVRNPRTRDVAYNVRRDVKNAVMTYNDEHAVEDCSHSHDAESNGSIVKSV